MAHGYSIDKWIFICEFSINGLFGMDIAWTLQPGKTRIVFFGGTQIGVKFDRSNSPCTAHLQSTGLVKTSVYFLQTEWFDVAIPTRASEHPSQVDSSCVSLAYDGDRDRAINSWVFPPIRSPKSRQPI